MLKQLRKIKSFALRKGKITLGQSKALELYASLYEINYQTTVIDLHNIFPVNNPVVVEVGFGMGDSTAKLALANVDINYIGIEVHTPGIGSLIMQLNNNAIKNVRYINHDAVEVINNMFMDNSIAGFHIFFPDPWHKKRHHKRRLIGHEFIASLVSKLSPGGYIHLATDWHDYALHMLDVLSNNSCLINNATGGDFIPRPSSRPITKFEMRGIKLGHMVYDIIFTKVN